MSSKTTEIGAEPPKLNDTTVLSATKTTLIDSSVPYIKPPQFRIKQRPLSSIPLPEETAPQKRFSLHNFLDEQQQRSPRLPPTPLTKPAYSQGIITSPPFKEIQQIARSVHGNPQVEVGSECMVITN